MTNPRSKFKVSGASSLSVTAGVFSLEGWSNVVLLNSLPLSTSGWWRGVVERAAPGDGRASSLLSPLSLSSLSPLRGSI